MTKQRRKSERIFVEYSDTSISLALALEIGLIESLVLLDLDASPVGEYVNYSNISKELIFKALVNLKNKGLITVTGGTVEVNYDIAAKLDSVVISDAEYIFHLLSSSIEHSKNTPGFVYFASGTDGLTKIGRSKNPEQRIMTLKSHYAGIKLLFTIRSNNMSLAEAYLHNFFEEQRIKGEWFDLGFSAIEEWQDIAELNFNGVTLDRVKRGNEHE